MSVLYCGGRKVGVLQTVGKYKFYFSTQTKKQNITFLARTSVHMSSSINKICKEIIAKNNIFIRISQTIRASVLPIFSGKGDNRCLLASNY